MKVGKLKKSIGDTSRIVRYMWYAFGGIVVLVVAAFAMIAWGWIGYMPRIWKIRKINSPRRFILPIWK